MNPVLKERLSDHELADIVKKIQSAVLTKEVTKNERGINMADEKYVISKASFEDFYETQDTLVSIIERMVDRIEKQDNTIVKFGAALAEVIAKYDDMSAMVSEPGMDMQEQSVESSDPMGSAGESMGSMGSMGEEGVDPVVQNIEAAQASLEQAKVAAGGAVSEPSVPGGEEFLEEGAVQMSKPSGLPVENEMKLGKSTEKAAFEAGYKAALAEVQKKNGVPVAPADFKTTTTPARPVSTNDAQIAQTVEPVRKSLSEVELAKMSSQQLSAWLKENGY